jgi:hypothetical protein
MGAKIVLSGEAQNVHHEGDVVTFTIDTGPATRHAPPGLQLYGATHYRIECNGEAWDRAHRDPDDRSALLIEGYLQPRRDEGTGQLYVAVVATTLQSTLQHSRQRLKRLQQSLDRAREAFKQARDAGAAQQELEKRAAALVQANQTLAHFVERHPGVAREGRD